MMKAHSAREMLEIMVYEWRVLVVHGRKMWYNFSS